MTPSPIIVYWPGSLKRVQEAWPRLKNIGLRHDGQTSRSVVKGWAFEIPEQTISAKHPRRTNQMSTRIRKAASELQYETFDLSHFGNSLECTVFCFLLSHSAVVPAWLPQLPRVSSKCAQDARDTCGPTRSDLAAHGPWP